MTSTVFLSHAGADATKTRRIAGILQHEGLRVTLDRNELREGDSFLSFMERALKESDYCLLLWSRSASKSPWVKVEWEAAFHRTVTEAQNFLIVGRLEEVAVPELLRPRLRVDLYPTAEPGVSRLLAMWRSDIKASTDSARPVVRPKASLEEDPAGETIYITSETLAKTFPMRVSMARPVAAIVEDVVQQLGLPKQLDVEGRLGVRYHYGFAREDESLQPRLSLERQGINADDLLWLQVEMRPFSATAPVTGVLEATTYRGSEETDALYSARNRLLARVKELGLAV